MAKTSYRPLSTEEISALKQQQCNCDDWAKLQVSSTFSVENIRNVQFSGEVRLGSFKRIFDIDGIPKSSGIYNAHLHNCDVADDVRISNVHGQVANYSIEKGAFIENIGGLATVDKSSFGNATKVAVLDETGSREIPIYEGLSSQLAYLLVFWRHEKEAIEKLFRLIDEYSERKVSNKGKVGEEAFIVNSGKIQNVVIGKKAIVDGASLLSNGTISAESIVGAGVIAHDFIFAKGSTVSNAAQVERCFVGEGTILSKQFSAIDSLFFANCQGFHGEAVSVFAAPYTVTHHKSTLLIGGLFSFFNAGSNSNQSNHMYKLGPIHYGITERGCKMASGSYIPFPSKIAAFSLISGVHKNKLDTSDFPFSYVVSTPTEGSLLIPAVNLRSVGTFRDAKKWAQRDTRKNPKIDSISFELFNPYIAQKILRAKQTLENCSFENDFFEDKIKGVKIRKSAVSRALELYQMALDVYFGEVLLKRLNDSKSIENNAKISATDWIDIGGLLLPKREIEKLFEKIKSQAISLSEIGVSFSSFEKQYPDWEWSYVSKFVEGKTFDILDKYIQASEKLLSLIKDDAAKEYATNMQACYGIDHSEDVRFVEFNQIRASVEENQFIQSLSIEIQAKIELATRYK